MNRAAIVALQPTLDEAVDAIHRKFAEAIASDSKAHRARIAAGEMLLELRERIEAGEAGKGVEWWPWYGSKFVRSRRDAEKVMAIAASDYPEAAAAAERERNREAKRRERATADSQPQGEPKAKPGRRRTKEQIKHDQIEHAIETLENLVEAVCNLIDPELLTPEQAKRLLDAANMIRAYGRRGEGPRCRHRSRHRQGAQ
jgi:hypothetical protein